MKNHTPDTRPDAAKKRKTIAETRQRKERRLEKQIAQEGLSKIGFQHEQELNRERIHTRDLEKQGVIERE